MKFKKLIFIIFIGISILLSNYSYGADFNVNSQAAILFNSNTGKILYEKNAYQKMYPASTTKIMTAILVLENCSLDDTAVVSENSINLPSGYVGASLQVGEILTINDLLHLLLVASANDAATVLAEHTSGSVDKFANMMNLKANEIGCLNTHFVNANGIHDDNHYSTAYDLLLISNYAMKNDTFRQIVSSTSYTVPTTNKYHERVVYNSNKLLHQFNQKTNTENIYYYEFATGIKTGYTTVAKNCLVASAKKDDTEFILVILGASENENDYNSQRYSDAKNLFETAFNNYTLSTVKKSNDIVTTIEIPNRNVIGKNLNLVLEKDVEFLIINEDLNKELHYNIVLDEDSIQGYISKGDVVGTVTYTYDGISYTTNLLAENNVLSNEQISFYFRIAVGVFLIILVFTIFEIIRKK